MKRNLFGATIVAGGLALFTSVGGFAVDYTTGPAAEAAVQACADKAILALVVPASLKGDALDEANALQRETSLAIREVVADANGNIKDAVAEAKDEDGETNAADLNAELNAIVDQACNKAIVNLTQQFDKGIAELVAESTQVEQPEANNADVEKPETEKRDSESNRSGSDREGND